MDYRTVDEWLDEIEVFSLRRERMPPEALPWVLEAWRLGAASAMTHHQPEGQD